MPKPPRELILDVLATMKQRNRVPAAVAMIDACLASGACEDRRSFRHCRTLAAWYGAALAGRFNDGLTEAIDAILGLDHAGFRPELAWAYSAAGFSMAIVGDFETGLQWSNLGVAEARRTGDRAHLPRLLSERASVLAMAGDFETAMDLYAEALAAWQRESGVDVVPILNNLAFAAISWARQTTDSSLRGERARIALLRADAALAALAPDAEPRLHFRALSFRSAALALLGRLPEAEEAYRAAEPLAHTDARTRVALAASRAGVLAETGRCDQARALLDEAWANAPLDLLDAIPDLIMETRIRVELLSGRSDAALDWSDRRFRRLESQYRTRLRSVARHAEILAESERARHAEAERARAAIEAANAERDAVRESLLQDLHDGLGTQLASARLSLQEGALPAERVGALLDECIADLYLVVDTLANTEGELGDALRFMRNRMQGRIPDAGPAVEWRIELDDVPPLPQRSILQALRIAQEALNNALRHARARRIRVEARYEEPGLLQMAVEDDGAGMPAAPKPGKGLHNMRSRAGSLGGELRWVPRRPGTRVEWTIPLASLRGGGG